MTIRPTIAISRACLIGLALLAALPSPGRADLTFTVTLATAPLESQASQGPFYLDLTLIGGNTPNTAQATISGFTFGAGGSAGSASTITLTGAASGSLGSGVALNDSMFYNDFNQAFTPGSLLTFNVDIATTSYSAPIPANFSFSILNGMGNPITTTDPSGADTLLNFDLTGPSPTFNLYGSPSEGLAAPSVSPSAVPEPTSWVLVGLGLLMAGPVARRRRRA